MAVNKNAVKPVEDASVSWEKVSGIFEPRQLRRSTVGDHVPASQARCRLRGSVGGKRNPGGSWPWRRRRCAW